MDGKAKKRANKVKASARGRGGGGGVTPSAVSKARAKAPRSKAGNTPTSEPSDLKLDETPIVPRVHDDGCECAACGGGEADKLQLTLGPIDLSDLELEFPMMWSGRIICYAEALDAPDEIRMTLLSLGVPAPIVRGGSSRDGEYVSYNVRLVFHSRKVMEEVTSALAKLPGVKAIM